MKKRKRGTVTVGADKGCLRLQFPKAISQQVWQKPQYYKTLGLSDTPENRAKAESIASTVQMDILLDKFDITLKKYDAHNIGETLAKVQPKIPGLLKLCEEYVETVVKPSIAASTYFYRYGSYLKAIKLCAEANIIDDDIKIRDTIIAIRVPSQVRCILDFLYEVFEWCIRNKKIIKGTENPYKAFQEDIKGKASRQKSRLVTDDDEIGEIGGLADCRAYSPSEAQAIIEAFRTRGRPRGRYFEAVQLLFLTGCRLGECFALQWRDINEDCSEIVFRHSLCRYSKDIKGLKTEIHGKTSRKFPCGGKLRQLLLNLRESANPNPKDFLFADFEGKPLKQNSYGRLWLGQDSEGVRLPGVIEQLLIEGKVSKYLKPYSSRHSFITWQLANGETPANVAKLVGNSPEMIYKHYVSSDNNARVAFEV